MELVSGKKIKVKTKMCSVCLELFCSFCQDYVKFPEFIIFHRKFLTTLKEGRRLGKWAKCVVVFYFNQVSKSVHVSKLVVLFTACSKKVY